MESAYNLKLVFRKSMPVAFLRMFLCRVHMLKSSMDFYVIVKNAYALYCVYHQKSVLL